MAKMNSGISDISTTIDAVSYTHLDEDMVEVAIKAVEEVFDWEAFLKEYHQSFLSS